MIERIDYTMSASASKKRRKLQNEQGLTPQEQAAAAAKQEKKRKTRPIIIFCIVAVLAIALIVVLALASSRQKEEIMDKEYADTIGASTTVLATCGDETITAAVYNYFYLSADSPDDIAKFNDDLEETLNVYIAAKEAGFQLSDEDNAWIEEQMDAVRKSASSQGTHVKADYLLSSYYGIGCNETNFREYLTIVRTVTAFETDLNENYPGTEAVEAEYSANPEKYDVVSYDLYTPKMEAAEAEESEEAEEAEEAEAEETDDTEALRALAEAAEKDFPEDESNAQSGNATNLSSSYNEDVANWLFDAARKEGDVKSFAIEDSEGKVTYRVFRYKDRDTNDYYPVNAEFALFSASASEEGEVADTASLEEAIAGVVAASSENPELSTDDFSTLISEAGGYYFGEMSVYKNSFSEDIINYLYSENRAKGDTQYFSLDSAYYLVRYQSLADEYYRITLVRNSLLTAYVNEIKAAHELVIDESAYPLTSVTEEVYTGAAVAESEDAN